MRNSKFCTLALDPSWQPLDWYTKKDVIRLLMKGAIRGFDADGNIAGWEPARKAGYPLSWRDQTVTPFPDAPTLHSGSFHETFEWKLPTVALIRPQPTHISNCRESISPNSVQGIYNLYNGICEFCGKKIPLSEATRDHYFPQAKGGANEIFNLVLACKKCNGEKGDQYPWPNHEGEEPRIRIPLRGNLRMPYGLKMREEWKQFLYRA